MAQFGKHKDLTSISTAHVKAKEGRSYPSADKAEEQESLVSQSGWISELHPGQGETLSQKKETISGRHLTSTSGPHMHAHICAYTRYVRVFTLTDKSNQLRGN